MLPLQITLEGFMSYRDKVTISFEDASLWMLAGGNGVGKSTVFDAMRWTLFGAHRGGRSGHEALIHRDREKLRVAFDLSLGDDRFRLLRTLSRTGRSTWQIEKLSGDESEKIPETDGRDGYENWLREHIGLSDETFCAAMYLAQGRGDAILSASPTQKYEMLREIVDISAFAALHERARTRASTLENTARQIERAWQLAPDAPAGEIEVLGATLRELNAKIIENAARREVVLRLEPLAAQWENLEEQRASAQKFLDAMRLNLQDAPQIERDFARLGELETLLPLLETFFKTRARLNQNARETRSRRELLQAARENLARETLLLENAQMERDDVEAGQKAGESARLDAISRLGEMAPRLADARQIALYESEIAALETQIAAFSPDLNHQMRELETRIEVVQNQKIAAEVLRRFAREKSGFQGARELQNEAQNEIARLEMELPAIKNEANRCANWLEMARENQNRALQEASVATTRRLDGEAAKARFEEVQDEANCYFCGQTLTPDHLQQEAARLENTLNSTKNEEARVRAILETQNLVLQSAQEKLGNAQSALRELETGLEKWRNQRQSARVSAQNARANAAETLRELSAESTALFDQIASCEWDETRLQNALSGDFPGPADLQTLQSAAKKWESWRTELRAWKEQERAQRDVEARARDRKNQLAPHRALWDDAAISALKKQESGLQKQLQDAVSELESGAGRVEKAREAVSGLQRSREKSQSEIAQLESRITALEAARTEIERAMEMANQPALAAFASLEAAALEAGLSRLQSEMSRLESGDLRVRASALEEARAQMATRQSEVLRLEQAIHNVPPEARRASQSLQNEARNLKTEIETAEEARREFQLEKSELERRRAAKTELETAHRDAQNAARQHKTLAELLGPHQLQRYLLREAENGILDEANAVLDRISSGTLRLELRADDDEIAGARKTAPKVLDIAVFRADDVASNSARASGMLPAFLSGSQRFRVAVAVALGIGRYATRGGGTRLEAVIIDEGFGSLDKIGRGEMIDELKMLGQELKRVILVSHQEEFAEAFPHRYLIENDGTTSTARLMAS